MTVIATLSRQRQKDHEFKTSLDYITRPCLKNQKPKHNSRNDENTLAGNGVVLNGKGDD
jgi:hypothetical protein